MRKFENSFGLLLLVASIFCCISFSINAQTTTFQKIYNVDSLTVFSEVSILSDRSYIVCGHVASGNHLLLKINESGQVQWAKSLGNFPNLTSYRVGGIIGGGYFLMGLTASQGGINLVRFDQNGTVIWNKVYYSNIISLPSIRQTQNGEFIISASNGGVFGSHLFIKTDSNGNIIWSKGYREGPSMQNAGCYDIEINTNQTAYTTIGYSSETLRGIYAISCDLVGNLGWAKKYSKPNFYPDNFSICKTLDGGYIVSGNEASNATPILMKIDGFGNFIWCKNYFEQNSGMFSGNTSVQQTSDGGYILLGYKQYGQLTYFPYLMKTNASGNFLWARFYSLGSYTNYNNSNLSVKQTADKGFIISANNLNSVSYHNAGWLIKTDSLGYSGCSETPIVFTNSVVVLNTTTSSFTVTGLPVASESYPSYSVQVSNTLSCSGDVDTRINEATYITAMEIYPNPSFGFYTLKTNDKKIERVVIFNLFGVKVREIIVSNENIEFDISEQPKGIYFLEFTGRERTYYSKIIKE